LHPRQRTGPQLPVCLESAGDGWSTPAVHVGCEHTDGSVQPDRARPVSRMAVPPAPLFVSWQRIELAETTAALRNPKIARRRMRIVDGCRHSTTRDRKSVV